MESFVAKKLAEVQAFIELSAVIIDRAGEPLGMKCPIVLAAFSGLHTDLSNLVVDAEELQTYRTKLQKTTQKLTAMMELYIGDEWDNPVEVLEWLSFYAGSAAAHAALVTSTLSAQNRMNDVVETQALSSQFRALLDMVITELGKVGAEKVTMGLS